MYATGRTTQEKSRDAYRITLTVQGPYRATGHVVVRASTFNNHSKRLRTRQAANSKAIREHN